MPARRIVVVVYPNLQSLDAIGPIEVFSTANREAGRDHYATELVATKGSTVRATSGVLFGVDRRLSDVRGTVDTLMVAGGDGTIAAMGDRALIDGGCLLCSEDKPEHCHRRLVAEYLAEKWGDVDVVHLV